MFCFKSINQMVDTNFELFSNKFNFYFYDKCKNKPVNKI